MVLIRLRICRVCEEDFETESKHIRVCPQCKLRQDLNRYKQKNNSESNFSKFLKRVGKTEKTIKTARLVFKKKNNGDD